MSSSPLEKNCLFPQRADNPSVNEAMTTDEELLRLYAEHRDEDAFREIVERHAGLVLGVAREVFAEVVASTWSGQDRAACQEWLNRVEISESARRKIQNKISQP